MPDTIEEYAEEAVEEVEGAPTLAHEHWRTGKADAAQLVAQDEVDSIEELRDIAEERYAEADSGTDELARAKGMVDGADDIEELGFLADDEEEADPDPESEEDDEDETEVEDDEDDEVDLTVDVDEVAEGGDEDDEE